MVADHPFPADPSAGTGPCLASRKAASTGLGSGPEDGTVLAGLRLAMARIEAGPRFEEAGRGASCFRLGPDLPVLLRAGALHEAVAAEAGDGPATFAFLLGLAARAADRDAEGETRPGARRPILLVLEAFGLNEAGAPYGHGIAGLGLDPDRLLIVTARSAVEVLWALEEGLRCGALGAALACFARLPRAYDLTASRRLVLAARDSGVTGALAVIGEGLAEARLSSAADSRWRIAARPSRPGLGGEPTRPALRAELLRQRGGRPAFHDLEWSHDAGCFEPLAAGHRPALPEPVAAPSRHRSGAPARAGAGS